MKTDNGYREARTAPDRTYYINKRCLLTVLTALHSIPNKSIQKQNECKCGSGDCGFVSGRASRRWVALCYTDGRWSVQTRSVGIIHHEQQVVGSGSQAASQACKPNQQARKGTLFTHGNAIKEPQTRCPRAAGAT